MSTQREPVPVNPVQISYSRVSVGQFAERFRGETIPLSNTFSYFCASIPVSEEVLKEYLEEPVAALPPSVAAMLPRISILLVPYLERSEKKPGSRKRKSAVTADRLADFVVDTRPADGRQSWASAVTFENETVLLFALNESDVAEYHYRFYRYLSAFVYDQCPEEARDQFCALLREEVAASVHGEVDDESWQAKQVLVRRQTNLTRDTPVFTNYARHSFIDSLTLYMHGICCDIDVETGPRQLPSRSIRRRLNLLRSLFPPPQGYSLFPEDDQR